MRNQYHGKCAWPMGVCLILVLAAGCNRDEVLGRVYGQVKFDGVPIKSGVVTFDNTARGIHMTAPVNEQGQYQVSMAKGFGLPLETYRVSVYPYVPELLTFKSPRPQPQQFPEIPLRYRSPDTSDLTLTVNAGDNPFDIDMQP